MPTDKRQRQKAGRQMRLEQARAAQARRKRTRRAVYGVILVVAVIALAFALAPSDEDEVTVTNPSSSSTSSTDPTGTTTPPEPEEFVYGTGACPEPDGSSPRTIDFEDAPQLCIDPARTYTAVFETNMGTIRVELDTQTAPGAANNFVTLTRYHYYDDTKIFRTAPDIGIVQGGSPHTQTNGDPGPGYTIPDEGFDDSTAVSGTGGPYRYTAGDLVYARPGGTPDSSSAQYFFCVTDDCSNLDSQGIYVEFGRVVEGLEVLEAMLALDDGAGAPSEDITVTRVTIEEA